MIYASIICEYNLFHNGHLEQIEHLHSLCKDICIISLMSGNYVQRGDMALLSKYERAKAAVECGSDLVLELPYPYSGGSAEYFAGSAVSILNELNIVDLLCFGSENGNIDNLKSISDKLLSSEYNQLVSETWNFHKSDALSYIKVRQEVYEKIYGETFPVTPNDILAVEYLKALSLSKSKIVPITNKRISGFSASNARTALKNSQFDILKSIVPDKLYNSYVNSKIADMSNLERMILGFFRLADPETLNRYADVTDGFGQRLCNTASESANLNDFFRKLSTKKYTDSKIRRIVLNCILGTTELDLKSKPLYTLVLAGNKKGCDLLRKLSNISKLAILTKPSHYKHCNPNVINQFETARRADALFALAFDNICFSNFEIYKNPYISKT